MKVLVFSDTHLSSKFEEKKYNFLSNIITQADKVIINGDFWEGYLITFNQFIESPWSNLFPLLKQKKAVYIHGNHDRSALVDSKNCYLFSDVQTHRYTLEINNSTYIFEHGNRLMPFLDETKTIEKMPRRLVKMSDRLEKIMIKTIGTRYQKFLHKFNIIIKKKLATELGANEYYVCGHTHSAEIDESSRFINTGTIKHGLAQYLLINESGHSPKEVRYL